MMKKLEFDPNNQMHTILVGAITSLVTDQMYTAKEVFQLLDHIETEMFDALVEIQNLGDSK